MTVLRELALDPVTWDVLFRNGDWVWLEGKDAVAQRVSVHLRTLLAEWRFDENLGTPWLQSITGPVGVTDALIRQIIGQEIRKVQGVDSVGAINVERNRAARSIRITGRITAVGEEVEFVTERSF